MKKDEKLNAMHNLFEENVDLTTRDLKSCGFSSSEITKLVEEGIIERVSRGKYKKIKTIEEEQNDVESLLEQGKILRAQNRLVEAKKYFEKCLETYPDDIEINLLLADISISNQKYQEAYNILKNLQVVAHEEGYQKEINLYLYLLSYCVELSEEEKSIINDYPLSTLIFDENDAKFNNVNEFNRIVANAYYKKYSRARFLLNDLINDDASSFEYQFIKKILNILISKTKNNYKKINGFIADGSYDEVLKLLEEKQQLEGLSFKEQMMLSIVIDMVELKNSGTIPAVKDVNSIDFKEAIENKDYKLDLELNNKYYENKGTIVEVDLIRILVLNINEMIDDKKEELRKKKEAEAVATFSDVVQCLLKQDVDSVYKKLHSYLKSINKEQYEFLLIDLIKISALENDKIFTKPMMALTYISKDNFKFDIDTYVQNFYESVSKNELKKAQVYLDILSKARNLGYEFNASDLLNQVLDSSFEMLGDNKSEKRQKDTVVTKDKEVVSSVKEEKRVKQQQVIRPSVSIKKNDPNIEFVQHKLYTLREDKGIIVLKPMPIERRRKLYKIIEDIPEIRAFSIGQDGGRRMVLRYIDQNKKVDIKETLEKANEYYQDMKYAKCLREYQKLLGTGNPPHSVYSKIGLLFLKLKNKNEAVKYLTVGTELAKKVNSTYDFTDLINSLTGVIAEEDQKTHVKMNVEDFEQDNNDYGIKGLNEIMGYFVRHQHHIDEVCTDFDLNPEQANIVKILIARNNYTYDHYENGDKLMKQVEQSEEKTPLVKSLFKETVKNKKFYRNRKTESNK